MAKRKTTTARNSNGGKPDPAATDADLTSASAEQTAAQNRIYQQVFEEITRFISTIQTQEKEVELCQKEEIEAELEYKESRKKRIEAEQSRDGSKHALYRLLSPINGGEVLPLFDKMEPADEKKHGENAADWRKDPISALCLSLPTQLALTSHDLLFVGQLQDLMLNKGREWWEPIVGMTYGTAIAVQDALDAYIDKKTGGW